MSYWQNKKVLVTGADGFIASHLTEKLINEKAKVSIIIRGTSKNGTNKNTFQNIEKNSIKKIKNIICCDISSTDVVNYITKLKPDYIFHLAASAYVPYSFDHPLEVNETNVLGTLNVLEACKSLPNLKRVLCTSSSEVYGSALKKAIDENHPLNPTSPYAASKVAADRYSFSYIKTYNLPITIIRPFNTYGPRHTYDVVPKFIKMALANQNITVHGNGKQSRDLTYVSDAVDAFLKIGSCKKTNQRVINFGTGKHYSIIFLAKKIKELTKSKSKITFIKPRQAEVQRLTCNANLCKKLTGWKPRINIIDGLKKNIDWEKKIGKFKI